MTDLGVATRVHGRADDALAWYRFYRNLWLWQQRALDPRADRAFLRAFAFRNRWLSLAEIIDAEERRAKVAPKVAERTLGHGADCNCVNCEPWLFA